jgi:hypothetical protein
MMQQVRKINTYFSSLKRFIFKKIYIISQVDPIFRKFDIYAVV